MNEAMTEIVLHVSVASLSDTYSVLSDFVPTDVFFPTKINQWVIIRDNLC